MRRFAYLLLLASCVGVSAHAEARQWSSSDLSIKINSLGALEEENQKVAVTISNNQSGALEIVRGVCKYKHADPKKTVGVVQPKPQYRFNSPLMGESLLTSDGRLIQFKDGRMGRTINGVWLQAPLVETENQPPH